MKLNLAIKSTFRKFGVDIHRFSPAASSTAKLLCSLHKFEIDLIFDVGANQGQFASEIRSGGYKGKIISFEPLSTAHEALLQASGGDSNWDVFSRCALGDHNGEIEINVAGNSVSSSILPMMKTHLRSAPESAYQKKELTPIKTLDAIAGGYLCNARAPFLKIDTQGFEWQVLEGARDTLPHIKGVLLELSLVPLYEGQHLWQEMIGRLESEGFTLWALQQGFTDPSDGRALQMDGIFYRS